MGRPPECDACCPTTTTVEPTTTTSTSTTSTTSTTTTLCPNVTRSCEYQYGSTGWSQTGESCYTRFGNQILPLEDCSDCNCACPSLSVINDQFTSSEGQPEEGDCAKATVDCCACQVEGYVFRECPTTTTTTTGEPTTTTTITPTTTTTTEGPTTTTTPEPCIGNGFFCNYEYSGGSWSYTGGTVPNSTCLCDCPSTESVRNEWNSRNGDDPSDGHCAQFNVPCCPSCFDYSITFSEECPTTTTTTGGPTTTTTGSSTTTLEPNPTAVIHCLGGIPDCCDDPSLGVVKPENQGCCDESRGKRNLPRHCQDFPTNEEAFKFWQDVGQNHLAYIFTGYTCAELETRISPPNFESTCLNCRCEPTTTTTTTTEGPTTTTTTTTTAQPTTTTTSGSSTTTTTSSPGSTTTTTSTSTTVPPPQGACLECIGDTVQCFDSTEAECPHTWLRGLSCFSTTFVCNDGDPATTTTQQQPDPNPIDF